MKGNKVIKCILPDGSEAIYDPNHLFEEEPEHFEEEDIEKEIEDYLNSDYCEDYIKDYIEQEGDYILKEKALYADRMAQSNDTGWYYEDDNDVDYIEGLFDY